MSIKEWKDRTNAELAEMLQSLTEPDAVPNGLFIEACAERLRGLPDADMTLAGLAALVRETQNDVLQVAQSVTQHLGNFGQRVDAMEGSVQNAAATANGVKTFIDNALDEGARKHFASLFAPREELVPDDLEIPAHLQRKLAEDKTTNEELDTALAQIAGLKNRKTAAKRKKRQQRKPLTEAELRTVRLRKKAAAPRKAKKGTKRK